MSHPLALAREEKRIPRVAVALKSFGLLIALLLAAAASVEATPPAGARDVFDITGRIWQTLRLIVDDLRTMPTETIEVAWETAGGETERHVFRAVPLYAVLDLAGARFGPERDAAARSCVVAMGWDGYQAVAAWGEFDPELGDEPVLLGWEQDGRPLAPERRPIHLIVPGDRRDARGVWGLVRLDLRNVDSAPRTT